MDDNSNSKRVYNLIDEILYDDQIESYLLSKQVETIYVNLGINSDSGL